MVVSVKTGRLALASLRISLAVRNAEYARDLLKEIDGDDANLIAFRLEKLIDPLILLNHYANKIANRESMEND